MSAPNFPCAAWITQIKQSKASTTCVVFIFWAGVRTVPAESSLETKQNPVPFTSPRHHCTFKVSWNFSHCHTTFLQKQKPWENIWRENKKAGNKHLTLPCKRHIFPSGRENTQPYSQPETGRHDPPKHNLIHTITALAPQQGFLMKTYLLWEIVPYWDV